MAKPSYFSNLWEDDDFSPNRDLRGYDWKVVADPTRNGDDPGLFYGRLFRMVDLRLDRDEVSTWPEGIMFEQVKTGRRLAFSKGKLVDLAQSRIIGRKPRNRRSSSAQLLKKTGDPSMPKPKRSKPEHPALRRFLLVRDLDATGVSGTGVVAEGTVFTDGLSVIHWLREPFATGFYRSIEDLMAVHGHQGETQLEYIDEIQKPIPEGEAS